MIRQKSAKKMIKNHEQVLSNLKMNKNPLFMYDVDAHVL